MKATIVALLLTALPTNNMNTPNMAFACLDGYEYCAIRKDVLQDLIKQSAPTPCFQREA